MFVKSVLVDWLRVAEVWVGADFLFGRDRSGNFTLLRTLGQKYGFRAEKIDPIRYKEFVVSSTRIRRLVAEGRVDEAGALLGHQYGIGGTVVHGAHRGRELGFPTANIETPNELVPPHGVYATFLNVGGANFVPDALSAHCIKVMIDTDPGFNQLVMSERFPWSENVDRWCESVIAHDRHLLRTACDELLIVHDGCVEWLDGDLDAYAGWLATREAACEPRASDDGTARRASRRTQRQAGARPCVRPLAAELDEARIAAEADVAAIGRAQQPLAQGERRHDHLARVRIHQQHGVAIAGIGDRDVAAALGHRLGEERRKARAGAR